MQTTSENASPMGVAAACRAIAHPDIRPSIVIAAIRAGKIPSIKGDQFPCGIGVHLDDVTKLLEPAATPPASRAVVARRRKK